MPRKQQLDGLNYRQAQKRNSEKFYSLSKEEQKKIRQQGYRNVGWNHVRKSWSLLQQFMSALPVNLVDFAIQRADNNYEKAQRGNDLIEVLESGKAVIQALKMKYQ